MVVKVINNQNVEDTWEGQTISASGYYILQPFEIMRWATSDDVLTDIGSAKLTINDGTNNIAGVNNQINFLKGNIPTDTDGAPMSRLKLAPAGWTFQDHCFEFTTSKLDTMYSKKADNTDYNFITVKFYEDIAGVESLITGASATDQTYLDAHCIMTAIEWEPTWDYDIIKGEVYTHTSITNYVRAWAVAVPDVAAAYGGSKELMTGGRNLKYHAAIDLDGKVVKHMVYSASYHTNKIKLITRHPLGYQALIEICIDLYKA